MDLYKLFNPFPKDDKLVYGKITNINVNKEEKNVIVNITLTNDEMLEFDEDIYGKEGLLNNIINYFNNMQDESSENIKRISKKYNLENSTNWVFNIETYNISKHMSLLKQTFDKFKPYFYELTVTITDNDIFWKYLCILKYCTRTFLFKLIGINYMQLIYDLHENLEDIYINLEDTYKNLDDINEWWDDLYSGYWPLKLICNKDINKQRNDIIAGNVLFSASPIKVKNAIINIVDNDIDAKYKSDVIDKKNRHIFNTKNNVITDDVKDKKVLENMMNRYCPKKINKIKYTMYYVGQGLCSYINFNRNFGVFYDIGFSVSGEKDKSINFEVDGSYKRYYNNKPKAIILSHWDTDHILGIVYCNPEIYDRIWIAPDINNLNSNSDSALRLSKYLSLREEMKNIGVVKYNKTLYLISDKYNDNIVYCNKYINIYKGKGTATNGHSTKQNNIGLVVELTIRDKNLLLTGDVDYFKMPCKLTTRNFDYLQVPHHGADVGTPIFKPKVKNESVAMIPVSEVNKFKHPYLNHLEKLEYDGFEIIRADKFEERNKCICNGDKDKFVIHL
ncbi:hypothetical protein AXY43_16500 [Clostridium sp. MF28]|uniref:hypothetical protein n=1 Tax=Clostridium TaxID=1485 RepID=UPI000CF9FE91|nr:MULTISPECIES: hypothetical protein [Clostridium]AVK49451.1 hypothetical protein AXY43_16500 [Clostridium sp. MF28]PSM55404.1 hypothetical protein C4L39_23160 [Clostridium diolis]